VADLKEAEAKILQQFLEDPNGRIALKVFFLHQVSRFEAKSQAHMRNYNMPSAQEAAFFASAFQNGFVWLEDFSREQNKKFE
jgi:streptogramin lyase